MIIFVCHILLVFLLFVHYLHFFFHFFLLCASRVELKWFVCSKYENVKKRQCGTIYTNVVSNMSGWDVFFFFYMWVCVGWVREKMESSLKKWEVRGKICGARSEYKGKQRKTMFFLFLYFFYFLVRLNRLGLGYCLYFASHFFLCYFF